MSNSEEGAAVAQDVVAQRVVAEGLFDWPSDEPRLIGSKCQVCGLIAFPAYPNCPRCGSLDTAQTRLSTRGTLWTWTRQRFQPKNPPYLGTEPAADFVSYGVGYVELPEARIEARLAVGVDEPLEIGQEMELVVVPFATDADGTEVLTYAFRPVEKN
ncbi:OB-fold domain-containing protein [Frankia sp. AgB1.9]|uniref:Zn-ribbon domain-containing OB-fold protein n=1 Tax=unclassified Frankia TaxID=2632575 RepID=UPI001931190E|nr:MULTISPECIES: OB-fold domain-containing protein [unclassified Frankia]MBL7488271.1 OB-fold domain-containing protein [Frankia sp. AgW1.1]MBL7548086.1 OB-fold domain-containing protein [Frankia sp. AgB1.9]MBL7620312.1 OB-fold domain-containing protein [Frankia sp. AgB1.8]